MGTSRAASELNVAVQRALSARNGGSNFSPDLGTGVWHRRSDGMACIRGVAESGAVREDSLLELTVREDGSVAILCGRATLQARSSWRVLGSTEDPPIYRVVFADLILGLVHGTLSLAADLADRYANYQGQWQIGLRLTGLRGAIAYEYVQQGDTDMPQPYNRNVYQRTTSAHTIELADRAAAVTERLVAPFLRGMAIDSRYLPYSKTTTAAPAT